MRYVRISFWALATLALASIAQAQGPVNGNASQIERGVSLSLPAPTAESPDLTRSLQTELKRVGCFEGAVDGNWDDRTRTALAEFVRLSKLELPMDTVTERTVSVVQGRRDRICPLACGAGRIERNGVCVAKAVPPEQKAVKPQPAAENKRPPRVRTEDDRPSSGMCWRQDGRGMSLVPCSEAPTGRRAY